MAPEVGTEAPDFTLKDQNNQEVTLSSFRGERTVLLVFYPFAFSGICTSELCAVRDDLADFQNDDVQILAISVGPPVRAEGLGGGAGLRVPAAGGLLAARRGRAGLRGVQRQAPGMAVRGTFLVDKAGIVRFAEVNGPGEPRDQSGWRKAVAALAA